MVKKYEKILFICTEGKNRSATAADLYSAQYQTKSIGIGSKLLVNPTLAQVIDWADLIVVMEPWHETTVRTYFDIGDRVLLMIDIPDNFQKGDGLLRKLIEKRLAGVL